MATESSTTPATPVSVVLDPAPSTTKYVLLEWRATPSSDSVLLVRGHKRFVYHDDIVQHYRARLEAGGARVVCLGGGRISLTVDAVRVYGHSMGYPWANGSLHHISAELVRAALPGVTVTHDDEGY